MDGEKAVAVITPTSNGFRPYFKASPSSIGTWFGESIPTGVVAVSETDCYDDYQKIVRWKTKDGVIHEMPYEPYTESVNAVIIAMKLTC